MNWSETYTALQQGTIDGQENPEPSIDSASVQDVQKYISIWNAYYDCLFLCINEKAYDQFTDEQKAVIDENARKAAEYQVDINRESIAALVEEWRESGDLGVTEYEDIDSESFKNASTGAYDWYEKQLVEKKGMTAEEARDYVEAFRQDD